MGAGDELWCFDFVYGCYFDDWGVGDGVEGMSGWEVRLELRLLLLDRSTSLCVSVCT